MCIYDIFIVSNGDQKKNKRNSTKKTETRIMFKESEREQNKKQYNELFV